MTQLSNTLDKVLNQYMLKVKVQLMNLLMLVGGTQMAGRGREDIIKTSKEEEGF
jgi:small neutral amino acid transporter SnatA (MarC family)